MTATRGSTAAVAAPSPGAIAADGTDPADAAALCAAQHGGDAGHGAGGVAETSLCRQLRRALAGRHGAGVSDGHAPDDAVGRRDGRRRVVGGEPRLRCRRRPRAPMPWPCMRCGSAWPRARCTWLLMLVFGPALFAALGGRGEALAQAMAYSNVAFLGSIGVWLMNTFASVIRGSGNMPVPSATLLLVALAQVLIGGALGLGWGPFPRLGMPGVAAGQVIAFGLGAAFLYGYLRIGPGARAACGARHAAAAEPAADILKVGALACISPLQTVLTILILTRLVAQFGTTALAGYGIGTRLEFLLVPIGFAIGVASVPLVGMAIGAGMVARARRVAWTPRCWPRPCWACWALRSRCRAGPVEPPVHAGPGGARLGRRCTSTGPGRLWAVRPGPVPVLLVAGRGQGGGGPVLAGTLRLVVVAIGRLGAGAGAIAAPGRSSRWSRWAWPCSGWRQRLPFGSRAGATRGCRRPGDWSCASCRSKMYDAHHANRQDPTPKPPPRRRRTSASWRWPHVPSAQRLRRHRRRRHHEAGRPDAWRLLRPLRVTRGHAGRSGGPGRRGIRGRSGRRCRQGAARAGVGGHAARLSVQEPRRPSETGLPGGRAGFRDAAPGARSAARGHPAHQGNDRPCGPPVARLGAPGAHERALVTVATMVGALMLARAVDEPGLSDGSARPH